MYLSSIYSKLLTGYFLCRRGTFVQKRYFFCRVLFVLFVCSMLMSYLCNSDPLDAFNGGSNFFSIILYFLNLFSSFYFLNFIVYFSIYHDRTCSAVTTASICNIYAGTKPKVFKGVDVMFYSMYQNVLKHFNYYKRNFR